MSEIQGIDVKKAADTKLGEKPAPTLEQMKSLAAQFESVLLGQMMHQMRESMFGDSEEDGKSSGFSTGPLADQIYSQLSLALSQAGGFGLSQALGGALVRQAAPDGATPNETGSRADLLGPPKREEPCDEKTPTSASDVNGY